MTLSSELHQSRTTMVRAAKTNTPEAAEPDQRQRWLEENREAIDQYNARIERDGLTLRRDRQF